MLNFNVYGFLFGGNILLLAEFYKGAASCGVSSVKRFSITMRMIVQRLTAAMIASSTVPPMERLRAL